MTRQNFLLSRMVRQGALILVGLGVLLAVFGGRMYLTSEYGVTAEESSAGVGVGGWPSLPPLAASCADAAAVSLTAVTLLLGFLFTHSSRSSLLLVATTLGAFIGPFGWVGAAESAKLVQHLLSMAASLCLAGVFLCPKRALVRWLCLVAAAFAALLHPLGHALPATLILLATLQAWQKRKLELREFLLGVAGLFGTVVGVSVHGPTWSGDALARGLVATAGPSSWTRGVSFLLWIPSAVWCCALVLRRLKPTAQGWFFLALAAWATLGQATSGGQLASGGALDRELTMVGWLANLLLLLTWSEAEGASDGRQLRRAVVTCWFLLFAHGIFRQAEAMLPLGTESFKLGAAPLVHSAPKPDPGTAPAVQDTDFATVMDHLVTQLTAGSLQILWIGAGMAFSSGFVLLFWPEPRTDASPTST